MNVTCSIIPSVFESNRFNVTKFSGSFGSNVEGETSIESVAFLSPMVLGECISPPKPCPNAKFVEKPKQTIRKIIDSRDIRT